jgi:hypothetical protein
MIKVTEADQLATKQHQQRFLTEGRSETELLWEAFATHRIEAAKAERDRLPSPFGALREAINSDPDYAWSWLCNLAVPIMDSTGVTHEIANQAAALIMAQMFDCDITKHPNFEYAKSPQQGYFEARIASERNSNGGQP